VSSFYAGNYRRLSRIKHRVDPTGFFHSPYTVA
jgi:FAD/FMN-containing dehydrogenase